MEAVREPGRAQRYVLVAAASGVGRKDEDARNALTGAKARR